MSSGAGRINCPACDGKGTSDIFIGHIPGLPANSCERCKGLGTVDCTDCDGEGRVECDQFDSKAGHSVSVSACEACTPDQGDLL